jgi:hypothetical protein
MASSHTSFATTCEQRRFAFYDTVASEDPFFARVRELDVYGLVALTRQQVTEALANPRVEGSSSEVRAAVTAEPLFDGLIAINAVLRHDVTEAAKEVEVDGAPSLVFTRQSQRDTDDLEPLTPQRVAATIAELAVRSGWARRTDTAVPFAEPRLWDDTLLMSHYVQVYSGADEGKKRTAKIAMEDLPRALQDFNALIAMLTAEGKPKWQPPTP